MDYIKSVKEKILKIAQNSFEQGLFAGTSGNLSAYIKENDCVIITPSSVRYESMTLEDLVVIDLDGNIIEGRHKPSSEWEMHCMVYKECRGVASVFHTHSPYATSFAVNGMEIPMILIEMLPFLGGSVPVAGIALPGSDEMGIEAIKVLSGKNACLLSNHGVLTVGNSVDQSYIRAEYVEDAARIYHYALQNGGIQHIPGELIQAMKDRMEARMKQSQK